MVLAAQFPLELFDAPRGLGKTRSRVSAVVQSISNCSDAAVAPVRFKSVPCAISAMLSAARKVVFPLLGGPSIAIRWATSFGAGGIVSS